MTAPIPDYKPTKFETAYWPMIQGAVSGFFTEFWRLYRTVALFGFPIIVMYFVIEAVRIETEVRAPAQYEFVASTVIKASCSPANNCTTRTDYRKTFRTPTECMSAIRQWFSYKTQSTVDVVVDASCRVYGLGEPVLGPVSK